MIWLVFALMPPAPEAIPLCSEVGQTAAVCVVDASSWRIAGKRYTLACAQAKTDAKSQRKAREFLRVALAIPGARTRQVGTSSGKRLAMLNYSGTNAARDLIETGLATRINLPSRAVCNDVLGR
jgi:hypothetical protein